MTMRVEIDLENKVAKTIVQVDGEEYHLVVSDDGFIVDRVEKGEVVDTRCYDFEDLLYDDREVEGD